jgi:hypothetical protein
MDIESLIDRSMSSLTVHLMGGLGNQLFQLAALFHIARQTRRRTYIQTISNPSPHSSASYFDSIFQRFRHLHSSIKPLSRVEEPTVSYTDWKPLLNTKFDPEIRGYFQDWRYIDQDFVRSLSFSFDVLSSYQDVHSGIFLHIRGGDYVGNAYHDVGLDDYYARAIAMFPGAHFFLVTNDLNYAMTKPYLKDLKYTLVLESEVDTLCLMSQCAGGICANSSFSWWGAFLNPNRKIVMPDRWFPHNLVSTEGYYFPGVIKCPV